MLLFQAKSYCYDTRSEYGGYIPTIITEETGISSMSNYSNNNNNNNNNNN